MTDRNASLYFTQIAPLCPFITGVEHKRFLSNKAPERYIFCFTSGLKWNTQTFTCQGVFKYTTHYSHIFFFLESVVLLKRYIFHISPTGRLQKSHHAPRTRKIGFLYASLTAIRLQALERRARPRKGFWDAHCDPERNQR